MLEAGRKGHQEIVVTKELTAAAVGSGLLNVYSTPSAIALAEDTSWRSVMDEMEPGQGTVGTRMNFEHSAATPVGMKVRCDTELILVDGRRLVFKVEMFDEAGPIAKAEHERFIVFNERFQKKADAKLQ